MKSKKNNFIYLFLEFLKVIPVNGLTKILCFSFFFTSQIIAQLIDHSEPKLQIQPIPKSVEYSGKAFNFSENSLFISAQSSSEIKAANYLSKLISEKFYELKVTIVEKSKFSDETGFVVELQLDEFNETHQSQSYTINYLEERNKVVIKSTDILGLLFGCVSLSELILKDDHGIKLYLYKIEDQPSFHRRIFPAVLNSNNVEFILDLTLRNKFETIAIASRQYPWYEINEENEKVLKKIKYWKDLYGGPNIMQMHNVYSHRQIEISNDSDLSELIEVLDRNIKHGVNKLMILADDLLPFEFGKGYVFSTESDKNRFSHTAEAHCFFINKIHNWITTNHLICEVYFVPAYYTFEDMNSGDLSQHIATPWEEAAFVPLKRDLKFIGENLSADIFIIWTGPNVRTRKLSLNDLNKWSRLLQNRIPFYWDNTIYSHHPFTSTALFTAYENDLPLEFYNYTAGKGMVVNGDMASIESQTAMITANDYLWNPEKYSPQKSIMNAMSRLYGTKVNSDLNEFKEIELELRKKIGERNLWFMSDTLWTYIRKIRFITEKNPLFYHLNYNRLKALRVQLKYSVPEPADLISFKKQCLELDNRRRNLLMKISRVSSKLTSELEKIIVELPDFSTIK